MVIVKENRQMPSGSNGQLIGAAMIGAGIVSFFY
jgi:hypothetical protein